MSWGNENWQNESETFENTWVKWQSVTRAGAQRRWSHWPRVGVRICVRLFMNYLICCTNPSPHVSTAALSTFPRHSFKYHGKQTGGRLFKRGDDLSSLRLARNNRTSVFRCPVLCYGGDALEMWEENSQKVIYEMSFLPVKTVQCHEARSISSAAHFFVTWDVISRWLSAIFKRGGRSELLSNRGGE